MKRIYLSFAAQGNFLRLEFFIVIMKYFLKNGCCEQVQFIPDSAETRFLLNALIFLPDEERIAKDVLKHFFSQFTFRGSDCLMNVFSRNSGKVNFENS